MTLEKLTTHYNSVAVLLSVVFVYLGAYIAISLCEQLRLSAVQKNQSKLLGDGSILIIMALSLGGVGIWCMHFVGMSALTLSTTEGLVIHLKFGAIRTVMSLVAVVLLLYIGLYIGARDVVYRKSKAEIIEMFIGQATNLTFKQIQNIKNGSTIAYLIGTKSLSNLVIGGMFAATGKIVMHYVGMSSILFPGVIRYNIGMIAASVIVAILGSLSAFWTLFRLLSIYPEKEVLRVGCALFLTAAKCGMHYIGMQSAEFYYDPHHKVVFIGAAISADHALMAAIFASMVFVGILITIIMSDLRAWLHGFTMKLNAADDFARKLQGANLVDAPAILSRYLKKREALDATDGHKRSSASTQSSRRLSEDESVNSSGTDYNNNKNSNMLRQGAGGPFAVMKLSSSHILGGRNSVVPMIASSGVSDGVGQQSPSPADSGMSTKNREYRDLQSLTRKSVEFGGVRPNDFKQLLSAEVCESGDDLNDENEIRHSEAV